MKAEELRIGNYVREKHYGLRRVVCIDTREGYDNVYRDAYGDVSGGFIRPIPLTEEWLLKFGFEYEHIENNHYSILHPKGFRGQYKIHFFPTINNMWHLAFSDKISGKHEDYIPTTHILYVHQLQNLYFALTGEELTIKE